MRVKMQFKFLLPQEPRKMKVAGGRQNITSVTDVVPIDHAGVENAV